MKLSDVGVFLGIGKGHNESVIGVALVLHQTVLRGYCVVDRVSRELHVCKLTVTVRKIWLMNRSYHLKRQCI